MPTVSVPLPLTFRRKLLFSAIVTGFSLFLAMLVLEVGGRFVFRRVADRARFCMELQKLVLRSSPILEADRQPGKFDAKFGYVLSSNASSTQTCPEFTVTYRTNALGFRTHELAPRTPREYRVMMIGDSFFYGTGLQTDETISAQLEQIAKQDPACQRPLKVYNFARPGYCTVQELVVLRTYAPKVAPDQVILGFFAANDVIANALTGIDEKGNFSPDPAMIAKYRNDLTSNLGLARFSLIGRLVDLSPFSIGRRYYQLAIRPDYFERNERWLTSFRDDCRAAGYRYGVVFQHSKDTLVDGWRNYLYSGRELARKLDAVCDREAIPRVEMLNVLRDGRPWQDYLYSSDAHPKPRGARMTAEAIYENLLKETLRRPDTGAHTADAGH